MLDRYAKLRWHHDPKNVGLWLWLLYKHWLDLESPVITSLDNSRSHSFYTTVRILLPISICETYTANFRLLSPQPFASTFNIRAAMIIGRI